MHTIPFECEAFSMLPYIVILQRRRTFLRTTFGQLGVFALSASCVRCGSDETRAPAGPKTPAPEDHFPIYKPPSISPPSASNIGNLGALGAPDGNGLMLPDGFSARIVARSGETVGDSDYVWHDAPDGGACFLAEDGGYVYVSNSETIFEAGVGALSFDKDGNLRDAYRILDGTRVNCAGGPTPWGTWLSCEEVADGLVHECDPFGGVEALARPALGAFKHEAAAVDLDGGHIYLTEDLEDGRFYRFTPTQIKDGIFDLREGTIEVMRIVSGSEGAVEWLPITDPTGVEAGGTRLQVPESTAFDGGEGIWYHDTIVYFATKGDNRIWAYDTARDEVLILYDDDLAPDPELSGVDNLTVTAAGDILVAEDGGNMQIVAISDGRLIPLVQIIGQDESEITGPALDPYRQRLYFSSQRGVGGGALGTEGITYEISGPFFV